MYSGVCASDLHTMSGGWGAVDYPQVLGHEIVGKAVRVGSKVTHIKVGDICGVGAQSDSCRECTQCKASREPYCDNVSRSSAILSMQHFSLTPLLVVACEPR